MKYKNMKIEISESQPLDDVVSELERLGYIKIFGGSGFGAKTIESYLDGTFDAWVVVDNYNTTITELKAMTND